jgi:hypothetical protein
MYEFEAAAERKIDKIRKLLVEQQFRIDRQRDWIAQLERTDPSSGSLRSAKELLREMIKTHEAILREVALAQNQADIRLRKETRGEDELSDRA